MVKNKTKQNKNENTKLLTDEWSSGADLHQKWVEATAETKKTQQQQ